MDGMEMSPGAAAAAMAVLILMAFVMFHRSVRFAVKLLINSTVSVSVLVLLALFGKHIGAELPLSAASAAVSALLGLPGIALMLFLKMIGI